MMTVKAVLRHKQHEAKNKDLKQSKQDKGEGKRNREKMKWVKGGKFCEEFTQENFHGKARE